jgi:hypothetical protein
VAPPAVGTFITRSVPMSGRTGEPERARWPPREPRQFGDGSPSALHPLESRSTWALGVGHNGIPLHEPSQHFNRVDPSDALEFRTDRADAVGRFCNCSRSDPAQFHYPVAAATGARQNPARPGVSSRGECIDRLRSPAPDRSGGHPLARPTSEFRAWAYRKT